MPSTVADRQKGWTDDFFLLSPARGADDGVEWQMALVVSVGNYSLLPSSLVVLIFDEPLDDKSTACTCRPDRFNPICVTFVTPVDRP